MCHCGSAVPATWRARILDRHAGPLEDRIKVMEVCAKHVRELADHGIVTSLDLIEEEGVSS